MILIETLENLEFNQRLINLNDFNREYYFVGYKISEYTNRVMILRKHYERGQRFLLTIGMSPEEFKDNYVLPFNKSDFNKIKKIPFKLDKEGERKIELMKLLSSDEFNGFFDCFLEFESIWEKRNFTSSDIVDCLHDKNRISTTHSRKSLITTCKKYLNILEKRGFITQNNHTFNFNGKYEF